MPTPLEQALADNRLRIVERVLGRCGYHADSGPAATSPEAQDFAGTEADLLRSGRLRCRRWWPRSLTPGQRPSRCPSPWSSANLRGLWRRLRHRKPAS